MIITYGKRILEIKYLYLVAVVIILLTDGIFHDVATNNKQIVGKQEIVQAVKEVEEDNYTKYAIILCFASTALFISGMSTFMYWLALLYYFVFGIFSLESYYRYGSFFQYPHVFSKLLAIFVMFFLYHFAKKIHEKQFSLIIYLIFFTFLVNLLWLKRDILSISAFVGTVRGFPAPSVYMLVIPLLFFINSYFSKKALISLFLFFILFGLIIFLNHRSVWIASITSLTINLLLLKKTETKIAITDFMPIITIPTIGLILISSLVISANPEIIDAISERIADIQNVKTQGTGSWRLEQFASYWPFIVDNFLIGMRFEGFELPVQFYQAEAGTAVFLDGTGHHFHSFYVDRLFYMGVVGLILLLLPVFYLIFKTIKKNNLTLKEVILVSFIMSGLFYGFSYNLPVYYFGILGIAINFIERENTTIESQKYNK
ncbi:hypothetical protein GXP67_25725 [Rhodocytophaga rosea]|uniref:O-antigen ligase-related domain-containing protein n=1 Tax=Rhodocytophaga rosea TaxID=2704465 RepID=A0A6C0GP24_9BACT|nr:O-antigen ligase family protein [Rhodocytophaga rosea]QHT69801.1 hypothetical protein GXP67_25725 [Rhodocytophaga rosea]